MNRRKALLALVLPLAAFACRSSESEPQASPDAPGAARATIELRVVGPEGSAYEHAGETLHLGPPTTFHVSRAFETSNVLGLPALGFEIAPQEREAFTAYTETVIDERVALLVADEVLSAPRVVAPVPGIGIIDGGSEGFAADDLERWIAILQPQ
ncbi:MAG: hypothetical protein GY711_28325 [bacterium]|nr:hypothetical protein [bacterium]